MSKVLYMHEYLQRKQKEKIMGYEKRTDINLDRLLERVSIMKQKKREAQQPECQDTNGGNHAA